MSPPDFNVTQLDGYLKATLPGLEGVPRLERISGGQSNPTFFVTYDNRALVLRKQPPGPLLPSAHAIDREFRVMQALGGSGVPVPEVLHYGADAGVIGTPFYLISTIAPCPAFPPPSARRCMPPSPAHWPRCTTSILKPLDLAISVVRVGISDARSPAGQSNGARPARARTRIWSG
jgi:Phosphotransferase enzyme family